MRSVGGPGRQGPGSAASRSHISGPLISGNQRSQSQREEDNATLTASVVLRGIIDFKLDRGSFLSCTMSQVGWSTSRGSS